MATHATARFEIKAWDEQPYYEMEGMPKLTRAGVTQSYRGDIEGEGRVEYLMVDAEGGSASFVGTERVVGRLGDRSGSFVFQGSGTFEAGAARCSWRVVPGSGTGDLRGLRGQICLRHQGQFIG